MKLSIVICVLAVCALTLAVEHGPLLTALQPRDQAQPTGVAHIRDKRHLGLLAAGALGAGVIGAGALGAGIIGAKAVGAGLVGGALVSGGLYGHGRSYGGYGGYYGGGHGGYGGYGYNGYGHGYGGYGRGYGSYYPSSSYYVSDPWC